MKTAIFRIFLVSFIGCAFYLATSIAANIVQLASFADRIWVGSGQYVFFGLFGIFLIAAISPVAMYFMLPVALSPPEEANDEVKAQYEDLLLARLQKNALLAANPPKDRAQLPAALQILAKHADIEIRNTASVVFLSTALLKNGRFDGIFVLFTQIRMVWRIAKIFNQRPSPRQMIYLYSNVVATAIFIDGLDEIDVGELIAPAVVAVAPSVAGAVPGMGGVASFLANSLASGAANAFLTLRIGAVARLYCESLVSARKGQLRKSASLIALQHLGQITQENSFLISKKIFGAGKDYLGSAAGKAASGVKEAANATVEGVKDAANAVFGSAKSGVEKVGGAVGDSVQGMWDGATKIVTRKSADSE